MFQNPNQSYFGSPHTPVGVSTMRHALDSDTENLNMPKDPKICSFGRRVPKQTEVRLSYEPEPKVMLQDLTKFLFHAQLLQYDTEKKDQWVSIQNAVFN